MLADYSVIRRCLPACPPNDEQNARDQQDIHPIEVAAATAAAAAAAGVSLLPAAVTVSVAEAGAALLPAGPVTRALAGMLAE